MIYCRLIAMYCNQKGNDSLIHINIVSHSVLGVFNSECVGEQAYQSQQSNTIASVMTYDTDKTNIYAHALCINMT